MKWKVVPLNEAGESIQRGVTSIESDAGQVQLRDKMGHAFWRCTAGTVKKVVVYGDGDAVVHEWNDGDTPLPKPEKVVKATVEEKTEATAEEAAELEEVRSEAKPKKTKAKSAAGKDPPKGKKTATKKTAAKANGVAKPAASKTVTPKVKGDKRPGVIQSITTTLHEDKKKVGISQDELVAKLAKLFPERDVNSMRNTVKTQLGRQGASKKKDPKRGWVYYL